MSQAYSTNPIHTLLLVRHGDSVWNGGEPGSLERFTGWTDVGLTDKGRYEALTAAEEVSSYSYEIDACFTSILSRAQLTAKKCLREISNARKRQPRTYVDYRLNERHYGALQSYIKKDVENGKFGHDPHDVYLWRRSWYAQPPPLQDKDPRRFDELQKYSDLCGGEDNIPRGESLEMVAKNRVRPLLNDVITPLMDLAAAEKHHGGTGLVVAHANSLRALVGVICEVEGDPSALRILEALRIPTGVPLVLKYQRTSNGNYQVCDLPEAEECVIDYLDGSGPAMQQPPDLGHPSLPVWPLNTCIPPQDIFDGNLRVRQLDSPVTIKDSSLVC